MNRTLPSVAMTALAAVTTVISISGCKQTSTSNAPETAVDRSTTESSKEPTPRTAFERDLQFVRNNQYTHVWVFSRKDGKPFDKDDGDYLRKTAPHILDWVGTDEGKRYIAGSNFDLEPETWKVLRQRFVIEDYSGK